MPFHGGMPLELQSKPLPLSQAKRSCCLSIGGFGLCEEKTPDLGMVPDLSLVVLKLWLLISFQSYFMNPVEIMMYSTYKLNKQGDNIQP